MATADLSRQTTARRTARLSAILDLLAGTGQIAVGDLADSLTVSEATLRRDLALLETQDLIKRTHGGARLHEYPHELPVRYRDGQNRQAKVRIAQACAATIARGPQAIALGGGTTTSEVARHLADRSELTIITNAINIAMELTMRPRLRVFVTGGLMRSESYELVGAWTERFLESLNIAVAIMGVDGISADGGLTTHDAVEARTNQRMIERAQRVVVVADGSKLGQVTMAKMADVGEVDLLITAADAPADQVALLRAAGLDIRLVPVT
jgi:DeoR family transcriptional regulator of aga operon